MEEFKLNVDKQFGEGDDAYCKNKVFLRFDLRGLSIEDIWDNRIKLAYDMGGEIANARGENYVRTLQAEFDVSSTILMGDLNKQIVFYHSKGGIGFSESLDYGGQPFYVVWDDIKGVFTNELEQEDSKFKKADSIVINISDHGVVPGIYLCEREFSEPIKSFFPDIGYNLNCDVVPNHLDIGDMFLRTRKFREAESVYRNAGQFLHWRVCYFRHVGDKDSLEELQPNIYELQERMKSVVKNWPEGEKSKVHLESLVESYGIMGMKI